MLFFDFNLHLASFANIPLYSSFKWWWFQQAINTEAKFTSNAAYQIWQASLFAAPFAIAF